MAQNSENMRETRKEFTPRTEAPRARDERAVTDDLRMIAEKHAGDAGFAPAKKLDADQAALDRASSDLARSLVEMQDPRSNLRERIGTPAMAAVTETRRKESAERLQSSLERTQESANALAKVRESMDHGDYGPATEYFKRAEADAASALQALHAERQKLRDEQSRMDAAVKSGKFPPGESSFTMIAMKLTAEESEKKKMGEIVAARGALETIVDQRRTVELMAERKSLEAPN